MLDEYEEEAILLASAPDSLSAVKDTDCPLIVTFTKILSMVDNSLRIPFFGAQETRNIWHAEGAHLGKRVSSITLQIYLYELKETHH
jgi:hypothetical protein